ncbi:MAG TPA: hypothetical protein VF717_09435 [Pyrinomonadaceae bacterium]
MALSIAGAVSTGIAWFVNRGLLPKSWNLTDENGRLHGRPALFVALVISAIVSLVALWLTGDADLHAMVEGRQFNLSKLYTVGWAVFGIATLVFKVIFPDSGKSNATT